jgi:hypothetical protein
MRTRIIEVTNGEKNWGKFLIGDFTDERHVYSVVDTTAKRPLFPTIGIGSNAYLVLDLQTEEGGIFQLGGLARADLDKHKIWVCPMFEPFLEWLYARYKAAGEAGERHWWEGLPPHVDLPDAPFALSGYRREGA